MATTNKTESLLNGLDRVRGSCSAGCLSRSRRATEKLQSFIYGARSAKNGLSLPGGEPVLFFTPSNSCHISMAP
jgi:hypothetical protein